MGLQKVGLIGIPGSLKTITAKAYGRAMEQKDDCGCFTPVGIIDHYAESTGDLNEWAIGLDGGWLSSIHIAMERYGAERAAKAQGKKTIITCGTMIESSVYMTMHFEEITRGYESHEMEDAMTRAEAGMRLFGCLYMDSFHYDRVFYLPPIDAPNDERMRMLDKNIQAAFNAFNLTPVEPLMIDADNTEELILERVKRMLAPRETNETETERTGATSS